MDESVSGQSSANAPPGQQPGRQGSVERGESDHLPDGTYAPERQSQQRGGRGGRQDDYGGSQQYYQDPYEQDQQMRYREQQERARYPMQQKRSISSGRSYHGGGTQYDDDGNMQHWRHPWGPHYGWGTPFGAYYSDPFLTGLLYASIFQREHGGNRQEDDTPGRTESGRFREGHSGRFGRGGSRQHEYEPWPKTFEHMGYPTVPFHPGLEFQPPSPYQGYQPATHGPFPPAIYGGMPQRSFGYPGGMQHSGTSMMSPIEQMHFAMAPDEIRCMEDIMRKLLHEYEHFRLRGGSPRSLKQIVIDLEQQ